MNSPINPAGTMASQEAAPASSKKFPLIWVLVVLAAALLLRINALWLPHWRGDQAQYVILSMKLTNFGLDGYNLRQTALGIVDVSPIKDRRIEFTALKPLQEDVPGMYLNMMKDIGQGYYDEPLHVRAPLLPYILALSHRLFAGAHQQFMVLSYGFKPTDPVLKLWPIWSRQLWAAIVPLFFNLGLIALAAFLAWSISGSRRITVYTAVLLAANPLAIWLAHRILSEDPATFWVTASFTALALGRTKFGVVSSALGGFFMGLAILTNQRVGLATLAAVAFVSLIIWQEGLRSDRRTPGGWVKLFGRMVFHPFYWVYSAVILAVTGFWFFKVIEVYGEPLHRPSQGILLANIQDTTGWFAAVSARPHPSILFAVGIPLLFPLFVGAYLTWPRFWSGIRGIQKDKTTRGIILLWMWVLVYYLYHSRISTVFDGGNREHRYFYPAYPAIAILAAFGLDRVRQWAESFFGGRKMADGLVSALLVASVAWGCWLAYPKVFGDQLLF